MCKTRSSILIILLLLLLLFQKIKSCKTNKVEVCTNSVSAGGEDFSNEQKGSEFSMFSLHAPSIIATLIVLFVSVALIFIVHKLCCGNSIAKSLKRRAALETGERAAYVDKI